MLDGKPMRVVPAKLIFDLESGAYKCWMSCSIVAYSPCLKLLFEVIVVNRKAFCWYLEMCQTQMHYGSLFH